MGKHDSVPHQDEVVTPRGFVHHVARDEQAEPGRRKASEQLPEVTSQYWVEANSRFVEDE